MESAFRIDEHFASTSFTSQDCANSHAANALASGERERLRAHCHEAHIASNVGSVSEDTLLFTLWSCAVRT